MLSGQLKEKTAKINTNTQEQNNDGQKKNNTKHNSILEKIQKKTLNYKEKKGVKI